MINLKIFNILETFSQNDWDNLVLYIKSSDAISGRKYLPLVLELKNFGTRFSELEKIPASEIFEKAYKKTFNTHTIFNRQSELLNLLKIFLEKNAYKKDLLTGISFYFSELISRNLMDIFYCEYKGKKDIIENDYYNENSFKTLSKIIENKSDYFALKNDMDKGINAYCKSCNVLLAEILSNLYKTGQEFQILKQYKLNKNNSIYSFIDFIDSDNFFCKLEKQNEPIFIVPLIHYYIFKSLQNPDCKRYISKAKQIYFANEKQFPEKFKLHIYRMIMSYYYEKINRGEEKYFKDLFLLFKRKLKQNLVSDFTERYFFYNNIFCEYVITGLKVKQYKWVEMVIKKYSPLLPEDIREDEYTLAMIRLHFAKKEHEKIFEMLNSSKIKNKKIYMDSIYYKLISCYELERYEECYKEIDNVRHYLKNNREKILKVRVLPLKKYLDGFSKLLNYRTNPYDKNINSIYYEFEKLGISKEDWMYKKFQEISE